jgi:ADP-ribosylglycohydrolase
MNLRAFFVRSVVIGILFCGLSAGCQNMNTTQKWAGLGAGSGAILGALIGHQSDKTEEGAAIGAALGGVGGALAGNAQDMRQERDDVIAFAAHEQEVRRVQDKAMSNNDVIMMVQKNGSDQLIIDTIRHTSGNFDTSPTSVIYLQNQGVSEAVIRAMRENNLQR